MRKRLQYALALITPFLAWGLYWFLLYGGFSGSYPFINKDLPRCVENSLACCIPMIASLGVALEVHAVKQNQWSPKSVALFLLPFLFNMFLVFGALRFALR